MMTTTNNHHGDASYPFAFGVFVSFFHLFSFSAFPPSYRIRYHSSSSSNGCRCGRRHYHYHRCLVFFDYCGVSSCACAFDPFPDHCLRCYHCNSYRPHWNTVLSIDYHVCLSSFSGVSISDLSRHFLFFCLSCADFGRLVSSTAMATPSCRHGHHCETTIPFVPTPSPVTTFSATLRLLKSTTINVTLRTANQSMPCATSGLLHESLLLLLFIKLVPNFILDVDRSDWIDHQNYDLNQYLTPKLEFRLKILFDSQKLAWRCSLFIFNLGQKF